MWMPDHLPEEAFESEAEHPYGLSVGDLMSALLLMFVLLLTYALLQLHKSYQDQVKMVGQAKQMQQIAQTYKNIKKELYEDLEKEFSKDKARWKAQIDADRLAIVFLDPEVLFAQGQANLQAKFKNILQQEQFVKRYLQLLHQDKYRNHIEEIRIEGHTSSEWSAAASRDAAYFGNMRLSQDRTRSVLEYVWTLIPADVNREWVREKMTANGLSFSKLQFTQQREDKEKSRRVEFRVVTDAEKQINSILNLPQ
jgi:outer membrane protein OmpA-like peptidoglycan-associated protein